MCSSDLVFESLRMTERSSLLFPHADDAHLAEAALVLASKPGVRLDPIDNNNGVYRIGISIEIRGPAVGGYAKLHRLHRCADGCADRLLRNPQSLEHTPLAFSRGSTVTAHSRENKRIAAKGPHLTHDGFDHEGDVADAAAPSRNGDRHSRLEGSQIIAFAQLPQ